MVCPSEEILRRFLSGTTDLATSTETVLHVIQCVSCRDRVASWNEKPRLEQILRTLADGSGVEPLLLGSSDVIVPANEETKVYPQTPLRRVGQYDLLRSIGRGGGGEVFEAMHVRLRRRLAVKILSKKDTADETVRRRFFREMESIGQLNHPHIVHAHDAGDADGTLYLAMELVNGENVELLARRVGPLPVAEACEIVRQAALGLQHIHENGLVHRDLKPSNLLTSTDGVKIADLGLALLRRNDSNDDQLTGHHTVLGTADYIAPEQTEKSHHVDIRADIYSLGCTLFRLLSGRPPYASPENNTPMRKMWAHQSHPIPDIQRFRSDIPAALSALLSKAMAKDPNDRFAEPIELAEALLPFSQASDVPSLVLTEVPGPVPGSRSSTDRDSGNALKTPSLSSQATAVQSQSVQSPGRSRATIILSVCLVGMLAWVAIQQLRAPADRTSGDWHSPSAVGISEAPNDHPTPIPIPVAPPSFNGEQATPPLGPIAMRWKSEFGQEPLDLPWGRPMDAGSARIDEGVGALVVLARKSVRLAQLGQIKPRNPGLNLQFKVHNQSSRGEYGVFLGFRKDRKDTPEFIEFHAVAVVPLSTTETHENVIVRRSLEKYDIRNGTVVSTRNHHVRLQIPLNSDAHDLDIQIRGDSIFDVNFAGFACPNICSAEQNSYYEQADYEGPFGVFVKDTSVWFSNPRLEWIAP